MLSVAYWAAFSFRFEFAIPPSYLETALMNWPYVIVLQYAVLAALGVPTYSWRYVSMREMLRISIAVAGATLLLIGLRLGLHERTGRLDLFQLPLGVIAMNTVLGFVLLVGTRATRRLQGEARERRRRATKGDRDRVILIGAGQAGVLVARELAARPDLGLHAVGFLDDDRLKVGSMISGLPVLGTTDRIAEIAERKRVKRVLITIAQAPGPEIRKIVARCNDAGLDTKIIPGIYEIVGDRVNLSRIRDVAIEDLLGREPVQLDEAEVAGAIAGKVVVVTGAGGSIGSELCRQVARWKPQRLILIERFENALFEIHRELSTADASLTIDPRIADVGDAARIDRIFTEHRPDIIFHAAAHKNVPMMEWNPGEALKNNVGGTRTVAELADRYQVGAFVLVSTDKAVNPSSIMGATKRVVELYCQALAETSKTRFITVRFGNVLGSNGSVIPIFKDQIARGGPVTVTHPDMKRYFMTIPEAAQLVVQAGTMGAGGEVYILDMGEPVKIVDLARDLIALSGMAPDDIDIVFSGVRPGEKLFEELATDGESADKTKHPKIFIGRVGQKPLSEVAPAVDGLLAMANTADAATIRGALQRLVPEYTTAEAVTPPSPSTQKSSSRRSSASGSVPALTSDELSA
jgi:FlaA1/EpsC-like NDP-sugar epimerase